MKIKTIIELQQQYEKAMNLLLRAADYFGDCAPDSEWFRDYFLLTEDHMILTDEGWQPGVLKQDIIDEYGEDAILGEVNGKETLL